MQSISTTDSCSATTPNHNNHSNNNNNNRNHAIVTTTITTPTSETVNECEEDDPDSQNKIDNQKFKLSPKQLQQQQQQQQSSEISSNYLLTTSLGNQHSNVTSLTNVSVNDSSSNILHTPDAISINDNTTASISSNKRPIPQLQSASQNDLDASLLNQNAANELTDSNSPPPHPDSNPNNKSQKIPEPDQLKVRAHSFDSDGAASYNYSSENPDQTNSNGVKDAMSPSGENQVDANNNNNNNGRKSAQDTSAGLEQDASKAAKRNESSNAESEPNDESVSNKDSKALAGKRKSRSRRRQKNRNAENPSSSSDEKEGENGPNSNERSKPRMKKKPSNGNLLTAANSTSAENANNIVNTSVDITNEKNFIIEYPYRSISYQTGTSGLYKLLKMCFIVILNLVVLLPLILLFVVFLTFQYFFRLSFKLLHLCHLTSSSHDSPDRVPEFLTPIELFWLYNSKSKDDKTLASSNSATPLADNANNVANDDSNNLINKNGGANFGLSSKRSICSGIFVIEGSLSKNAVRDLVQNRIVAVNSRTGQDSFLRFTQRIYRLWGYGYVWLNCTNFNIDEHITEIDNDLKTQEELQSHVSALISKHEFNFEKPLWQVYYKKNFGPDRSTVLIFMFHMSFADGVSLTRLFFKNIVDNRNSVDVRPRFAYYNYYYGIIRNYLIEWHSIFYHLLFKFKDNNPLHRSYMRSRRYMGLKLNSVGSGKQPGKSKTPEPGAGPQPPAKNRIVVKWSEPFNLLMLNRIKLVTRSKMNDVIVSILAGIVRNYLQQKGINNPKKMSCLIPIDLTCNKYPFKLENQATLASVDIPVNIEGSLPRLWTMKYKSYKLKTSSEYMFFEFFSKVSFTLFPYSVAYALCKSIVDKNTFIASSLAAGDMSLASVSVCNRAVRNFIYLYPMIGNIGISFSVVTFSDEIRLAMMADSDLITNPEIITTEFVKLLEVLHDLLANRRIPGEVRRLIRAPSQAVGNFVDNSRDQEDYMPMDEMPMQSKMAAIQQELQVLSESLEHLKPDAEDYEKKKQAINIKSEKLKKEFRIILMQMQAKQSITSQAIPSDDEDEMDPQDRFRLRSSSIASRASISSHSKKNRDSIYENERPSSSRKVSMAVQERQSRQGSLSHVVDTSNMMDASSHHHGNSESVTIDNELPSKSRGHLTHHHHTRANRKSLGGTNETQLKVNAENHFAQDISD